MATGSGADSIRIIQLIFEIIAISLIIGLYVRFFLSKDDSDKNLSRVPTKQISVTGTGVTSQSASRTQSPKPYAMSPSLGPMQPTMLAEAIRESIATDTPYDPTQDPQARFFNGQKHFSKLKSDKVEYVEILSKQCTMQSANIWLPAKITKINDKTFEVDVEFYLFTPGEGCKFTGEKETLNLANDSDSARFRIHLFGCPEPWKLPIDKTFGIPKILVQLMGKLLHKKIRADKEVGVFRVSADKMKLLDYKIAICQYDIENYDYRLAQEFKEQEDKQKAFDVHCISALIKDWVRQFPETIVKYDYATDKLEPNNTGSQNDALKGKLFEWLTFLICFVKYCLYILLVVSFTFFFCFAFFCFN